MIDLKTLRELVKIMVSNDLTEVDLQDDKGEKVSLKRAVGGTPVTQYVAAPAPVQQVAAPVAAAPAPAAGAPAAPKADDTAGLIPIKSPMVGTFYAAPSPEAKPFVAVGTKITGDKNVCIIEAMKVFNEIKAETSGTVEKVVVSSGQAVEFGQTLFYVRPD